MSCQTRIEEFYATKTSKNFVVEAVTLPKCPRISLSKCARISLSKRPNYFAEAVTLPKRPNYFAEATNYFAEAVTLPKRPTISPKR